MSEKKEEVCVSLSNDVLDKLYLLKYDIQFVQKNLNDLTDTEFDTYDDPNTVAQNIQHEMGKLGINMDIRGNTVKLGYGKHVCEILLALIKKSLKSQRVRLGFPEFPKNDISEKMEMDIGEEEGELEFDDNIIQEDEDEEGLGIAEEIEVDKKAIESKVNAREWKLECAKVKSRLDNRNNYDQKEWRQHIERAKTFSGNINEIKSDVKLHLERLSDLLGKQLDKIMSRENQINKAMTDFGEEFREKNEKYKYMQDRIEQLTARVKKLNDEYSKLSFKNDQLQAKLQEQGNSATNDEPLIRIKRALTDIQKEIQSMDIRIGVLNNIVWTHNFEMKRQQIDNTLIGKRNYDDKLYNIMEAPEDMDDLED